MWEVFQPHLYIMPLDSLYCNNKFAALNHIAFLQNMKEYYFYIFSKVYLDKVEFLKNVLLGWFPLPRYVTVCYDGFSFFHLCRSIEPLEMLA